MEDEAVTGVLDSRPAFDRLMQLIKGKRLGMLVVTEQSRLSRSENAMPVIKDVVFHGGRFISITEGVDTDKKGWQLLVSISEVHHARSNVDTAERVRGGQEGRIRDGNGSAGDFCYGYRSEFEDPAAAVAYCGRGPKPKRKVVIDPAAASLVKEVFHRFAVANQSMNAIVRWWNDHIQEFPNIRQKTSARIRVDHVRRILNNKKYVGIWTWGASTTVYDGKGIKGRAPARPDQTVTVTNRPNLRIIDDELWAKAQSRIAQLKAIYGMKPNGKKRGPVIHYRRLYERTLLGGNVICGNCGARMVVAARKGAKFLICPNHKVKKCSMGVGLPFARAEKEVLGIVADVLRSYPAWLRKVVDEMRRQLEHVAGSMPDDAARAVAELDDVNAQLERLITQVATGTLSGSTVQSRVQTLEGQKAALQAKVAQLQSLQAAPLEFPSDDWIRAELKQMVSLLHEEMAIFAPVLRPLLGRVMAEQVLPPGRILGHSRLRVTLDGWAALKQILDAKSPVKLLPTFMVGDGGQSEEFVFEFRRSTRAQKWGPIIMKWRGQNLRWSEICTRSRLPFGTAYFFLKTWKEATAKP
jgi:DNA invertase Pin-like site-specific DNA recombinase